MTEFVTIVLIAIGLAMDAFAVSIAAGSAQSRLKIEHAVRLAVFFGAFQAIMPLVGWAAGLGFKDVIEAYDHWVAFGLLAGIGAKMLYESFKLKTEDDNKTVDVTKMMVVIMLSVATSIDALAVGITLTLITDFVAAAVITIGVITFGLSLLGCRIGQKVGHLFENRIEALGGLILIGIGIKILVEHLTGQ